MRLGAIIAVLVLAGCGSTSHTSSSRGDYSEDLTVFRPPVIFSEDTTGIVNETAIDIPVPTNDITFQLDSLLDTLAINNRKQPFIEGYTIQVYTGNSRSEATEVRNAVFGILPGSDPTISYDLPNYKVKVGKYFHRLEAQKDFAAIKNHFQNTILVPQQFRIQ